MYVEKAKQGQAIQQQFDETQRAVSIVQNYANSLKEINNDLRDELKQVLLEKHAATRLTAKANQLASDQREKRYAKQEQWRAVEDKLAQQEKSTKQMDRIMEEYRLEI